MQSILLQPWTSIASGLTGVTFTQDADQWVDLACYSDIAGFWIDVSALDGTNVQLTLQSSPSHDEAYFQPLLPPINLVAQLAPTFVKAVRMPGSTAALGRWARWQLTGTPGTVSGLWGATFRVRAVLSKEQLFSPIDVPGCVLWLRSDAGVFPVAGTPPTLEQWNDQSGNGYNVSQATQADQPEYLATSGPNNLPDVLFGGSGSVLLDNTATNLLPSGQSRTILVAGDSNSTSGGTLCAFRRSTVGSTTVCEVGYQVSGGGGSLYVYSDGTNAGSVATIPGTSIPVDTPFVIDLELSTSALPAVAVNGVAQTVTQTNGAMTAETSTSAGFTVGNREDTALYPWSGDIYELLVYDQVLSSSQLTLLRRYLGYRYGVAVP
jgi:hypothetical protein